MAGRISVVILALVVLAGYQPVSSQRANSFNGFELVDKTGNIRKPADYHWIIQNGIRFTGMPAFGKVETPDHIWDLVNYVRTLPDNSRKENASR